MLKLVQQQQQQTPTTGPTMIYQSTQCVHTPPPDSRRGGVLTRRTIAMEHTASSSSTSSSAGKTSLRDRTESPVTNMLSLVCVGSGQKTGCWVVGRKTQRATVTTWDFRQKTEKKACMQAYQIPGTRRYMVSPETSAMRCQCQGPLFPLPGDTAERHQAAEDENEQLRGDSCWTVCKTGVVCAVATACNRTGRRSGCSEELESCSAAEARALFAAVVATATAVTVAPATTYLVALIQAVDVVVTVAVAAGTKCLSAVAVGSNVATCNRTSKRHTQRL